MDRWTPRTVYILASSLASVGVVAYLIATQADSAVIAIAVATLNQVAATWAALFTETSNQ